MTESLGTVGLGQRIAVMGIGNILLRDEGVGPAVIQALDEVYEFPDGIDLLDRGTMGMALIGEMQDYDYILTIDAVSGTGEPAGTVFFFRPDEMADEAFTHGAHDTRFIDVLQALALLGCHPVGECIGVQVADIAPDQMSIGLSSDVQAAVPLLVETVLATLYRHGVRGIVDRGTGRKVEPPVLEKGEAGPIDS